MLTCDRPCGRLRRPRSRPAEVVVPNVVGMTLDEASLTMNQRGLRTEMDGHGIVTTQVPSGGSTVPASSSVRLVGSG